MNITPINEHINKELQLYRWWDRLPEAQRLQTIMFAERDVREYRPDAKVVFSEDRKGLKTHVGIYDMPLTFNGKHNFRSSQQAAPQLLGTRFEFRDSSVAYLQQLTVVRAWASAIALLCPEKFAPDASEG